MWVDVFIISLTLFIHVIGSLLCALRNDFMTATGKLGWTGAFVYITRNVYEIFKQELRNKYHNHTSQIHPYI